MKIGFRPLFALSLGVAALGVAQMRGPRNVATRGALGPKESLDKTALDKNALEKTALEKTALGKDALSAQDL